MRQGNEFDMQIKRARPGDSLSIPLEVSEAFYEADYVTWIANKDGTFTILLKQRPL